MKYYLITAVLASLCFSCESNETTVNPPDDNDTTIVTPPAPPARKTETETKIEKTITPDGSTTEKKETTEQE